MTKAEFIKIAKSFNLTIGLSHMGPVALYNHKTVMLLWENSLNPTLNSAIIFEPKRLKVSPIRAPPIKTESIILHEPIPVISKKAAPSNIAIEEVSPILPGIIPNNISQKEVEGRLFLASRRCNARFYHGSK